MSKAVMYGMKAACIPNRRADELRRTKTHKKNQDWTWNHQTAVEERRQRQEAAELEKAKEERNR